MIQFIVDSTDDVKLRSIIKLALEQDVDVFFYLLDTYKRKEHILRGHKALIWDSSCFIRTTTDTIPIILSVEDTLQVLSDKEMWNILIS